MKRIIAILLTAVLTLCTFSACGTTEAKKNDQTGNNTQQESQDKLAQVQANGKLIIALEGNWAPWSYHDLESDEIIGFDADIGKAIAEKLGVEAEFVEAPWESLFAGLDSGRYDLVINGVEITEERSEKYDFSVPYGYIHTALIVRSDNDEIKTFEDLKGKSTVNSLDSTYMVLAEEYGATAKGVSTLAETLTQVEQGRVDATLNADVSFYDYMKQQPDANLKIAAITPDASSVAIPMVKGDNNAAFRSAVNQAISELLSNGTIAEISQQYFGTDVTNK